ncbi:hypothetical protein ACFCWG_29200 [Streptomyces sp. NPDC056390]|uniref:hypothetical protein n=1 Tax=Streptomyces sp. NPDC056390 TaxID=3345806 RepID=UPI0035E0DF29
MPEFVSTQRFKLAGALAERFNTSAMVISEALAPERLGLPSEAMTPRLEGRA